MSRMQKLLTAVFITGFIVSLVACGGGGGGGGFTPITYGGNTAQATIDDTNAGDLAGLAVTGAELGAVVPLASTSTEGSVSGTPAPVVQNLYDLSRRLPELVASVPASTDSSVAITVTVPSTRVDCEPDPINFPGVFDGSMTISGTWDNVEGTITSSVTFNACNLGDVVLSGGASVFLDTDVVDPDGFPDLINSNIITTSTQYRNLSMTMSGLGSITAYGTVAMTVDQTPAQDPMIDILMSLVMREDASGLTAQIESYHLIVTETASYDEISISARIFDYDAGYVDVSTPTLLQDNGAGPYFGVLRLDGADGSFAEVDFSLSCPNGNYDDGNSGTGTFCYVPTP